MKDKHGKEIQEGDVLFNPCDQQGKYIVVTDGSNLFLGDFDSPLECYRPDEFWEIVDKGRHANIHPVFREICQDLT